MRTIVIAAAAMLVGVGAPVWAEDQATAPKKAPPPMDVTIKLDAPKDATEAEIAAALAAENAKHDPVAKQQAESSKRKADEDEAHHERIRKICDSIPEKSFRDDPSLRKMCN